MRTNGALGGCPSGPTRRLGKTDPTLKLIYFEIPAALQGRLKNAHDAQRADGTADHKFIPSIAVLPRL